ncbi:hypothetical protein BC834DRAFT_579130 [Gloeopeniophorella convolvens]|nr:hypothetical protein BC834DRAFT_579130 [Gloeopeniophorella convolvens]
MMLMLMRRSIYTSHGSLVLAAKPLSGRAYTFCDGLLLWTRTSPLRAFTLPLRTGPRVFPGVSAAGAEATAASSPSPIAPRARRNHANWDIPTAIHLSLSRHLPAFPSSFIPSTHATHPNPKFQPPVPILTLSYPRRALPSLPSRDKPHTPNTGVHKPPGSFVAPQSACCATRRRS